MWSQKIHFVTVKRTLVLFTGNPYKIDPQVIHSATELTVDMIYGKTFILSEQSCPTNMKNLLFRVASPTDKNYHFYTHLR